MVDVLVRNVPEDIVETLKRRAAAHRRSLQQEMLQILEQAAQQPNAATVGEVATAIRERLARQGIEFDDSTPLIRSDRER